MILKENETGLVFAYLRVSTYVQKVKVFTLKINAHMKDNIKIKFNTDRSVNKAHIGSCINENNNATLKGMLEGERRMELEQALGVRAYFEVLTQHIDKLYIQSREATKDIYDQEIYNTVYQRVKEKFHKNL